MIEGQTCIFDFNMLSGEEKHIKFPYKQMIVILEALENLKKDIEEFEPDNSLNKIRFENKLEEVNYLIEVIETGAEYNFHKHLDKCINRKEKNDDAGMDALSAAVVLKEEDKIKQGGK
ncbi:hypothetical protein ACFO6R_10260 [Eubacterium multiforme]|uniref:Uncharacterized protein n=1 Tax=Eubacterium multiforme TaxID=83339 RepID=A0ABT9USN0_9FIRM|nr:hypothetical protein [Eubacterium multiforme]MDQ0149333.1 hypothetical protein [Eubacterium multiforme]